MHEANSSLITSSPVGADRAFRVIADHVGHAHAWRVEVLVFVFMETLSDDYRNGSWSFHELSNGGFFMTPLDVPASMQLYVEGNGFAGTMSAEAAGIIATIFALNVLCNETTRDEHIQQFHLLRDFALAEHAEASLIAQAID